ncbi:hypothetical protein HZA56_06015 [Candidatus Poribacteria bacterium]|nr:hypothetical protein [Candidatus Poribacteria bacterium]
MRKNSLDLAWLAVWPVIGVLVWVYYGDTLQWYLVADDFGMLEKGLWGFRLLLTYYCPPHWLPVPNLFFHIFYQLFGVHYSWWHLTSLVLHTFNALLAMVLVSEIYPGKKMTKFLTPVFFVTFAMNYEVVFYISGIFYSLMASMYLLAIVCYSRYLRMSVSNAGNTKMRRMGMLAITAFLMVLALLTQEASSFLIITLFAWELAVHNRNINLPLLEYAKGFYRHTGKYFLLGGMLVLLFCIRFRAFGFPSMSHPSVPSAEEILVNYARAAAYLVFPFSPLLAFEIQRDTIIPIFAILLVSFLLVFWKCKNSRFPLVNIVIALSPTLLFSIIQARYLYLASIFCSMLLASAIDGLADAVSSGVGRAKTAIKLSIVALACFPILFLDKQMLDRRIKEWQKASELSLRIDSFLASTYKTPEMVAGKTLVFLNLPEGVPSSEVWPAYVALVCTHCRFNLMFDRIVASIANVQLYCLPADIIVAFTDTNVFAYAPVIEREALRNMCASPSYDVYVWDSVNERLRQFCESRESIKNGMPQ